MKTKIEKSYKNYERQYQAKGFFSQRQYPNEALLRFFGGNYFHLTPKQRSGLKVLELGCGSGANLWMAAREGFSAYGIDMAETGLALCGRMLKKWGAKAKLRKADMNNLPFKDGFFDIVFDVVSMQCVDLPEHRDIYNEVFRCLKKGGRFFQWHMGSRSYSFLKSGGSPVDRLTVDNIKNPKAPLNNNGLMCFLNPEEARSLLREAGFPRVRVETVVLSGDDMTMFTEYLAVTAEK